MQIKNQTLSNFFDILLLNSLELIFLFAIYDELFFQIT